MKIKTFGKQSKTSIDVLQLETTGNTAGVEKAGFIIHCRRENTHYGEPSGV